MTRQPVASDVSAAREAVAAAAQMLAADGLVLGTAGNVSVRTGELVAVTPTGAELGELVPARVAVVDLDGRQVEGPLAPTSELGLHLALHSERGDGAVAHTHAPVATALSCVLDELPVVHYQALALGGPVRVAAYATFGTPELAEHVRQALEGRAAALMANHGTVTVAGDAQAAVELTRLLEWECELYWRAAAIGTPRTLDAAQQQAVIEQAAGLGYGAPRPVEEAE